jgi:hypothetical protein
MNSHLHDWLLGFLPRFLFVNGFLTADYHLGWPEHLVVKIVTLAYLVYDYALRLVGRVHPDERIVLVGVERLAHRFDRPHPEPFEGVPELREDKFQPLAQLGVGVFVPERGIERPLEVVQDRKQLADRVLGAVLDEVGLLSLNALSVIIEIGLCAKQAIV